MYKLVKRICIFSILMGFLASCGRETNSSHPVAIVNREQFERAMLVIGNLLNRIEIIPFGYRQDGCYARALYMSMELAVQGIPSSSYFVEGNLSAAVPHQPPVQWHYHVAPMLMVSSSEAYMIDPSLDTRPLDVSDWLARMSVSPTNPLVWNALVPGSMAMNYQYVSTRHQMVMIESMAQMPAFELKDVLSACGTMYNYLGLEGSSAQMVAVKRKQLLVETGNLVRGLAGIGKLHGSDAQMKCSATN